LVFDRDEPLCFTYKTKENQDKIRELAKEIIKERVHQRKEKQPAEEEN